MRKNWYRKEDVVGCCAKGKVDLYRIEDGFRCCSKSKVDLYRKRDVVDYCAKKNSVYACQFSWMMVY